MGVAKAVLTRAKGHESLGVEVLIRSNQWCWCSYRESRDVWSGCIGEERGWSTGGRRRTSKRGQASRGPTSLRRNPSVPHLIEKGKHRVNVYVVGGGDISASKLHGSGSACVNFRSQFLVSLPYCHCDELRNDHLSFVTLGCSKGWSTDVRFVWSLFHSNKAPVAQPALSLPSRGMTCDVFTRSATFTLSRRPCKLSKAAAL